MFRPAARSILRRQVLSAPRIAPPSSSRNLFGSAAKPRRSPFKSALLRWGAAGAVVYYYATSSAFADEPKFYAEHPTPIPSEQDERPPSVLPESAQSGRRTRAIHTDAEDDRLVPASEAGVASKGPGREETTSSRREAMSQDTRANMSGSALGEDTSARDLEEEAGQEGAFNPETGEINWDCPCLGGMAHGPCGPEFREAFSCFVHSTADPKGVDCIEKFKEMQICFQKHPEVYGSELDEDEEEIDSKLEVLDPKNPEETRSPATSSKAPTSTHIDPERAKPDTEPTGTGSEEDAVKGAQHGIDSDQTKRS